MKERKTETHICLLSAPASRYGLLRFCIVLSFLVAISCSDLKSYGQSGPVSQLSNAISQKTEFNRQKEIRIRAIKKMSAASRQPQQQYRDNKLLFLEYQKFQIDSAVVYASRNLSIGQKLGLSDLQLESRLQLANLYSSSDRYFEARDLLNAIQEDTLTGQRRISYYQSQVQFYEHYNSGRNDNVNRDKIKNFRDSLLRWLPVNSVAYKINQAQQYLNTGHLPEAETLLIPLSRNSRLNYADNAMVNYLLGVLSQMQRKPQGAIRYFALSATIDVQNAIKDNASMQALALTCYQTGDIKHAYTFTQSAIEDALFCNVKFRSSYMSELYTTIYASYQRNEEKSKSKLKIYLLLISIMAVFLVSAVIYLYLQNKRISRIREQLDRTGNQLNALNKEISEKNLHLSEVNGDLSEANKIKETYIAQFFDLCSTYINKMEDYRKLIQKKAQEKSPEELFRLLRSTQMVNSEAEELYRIFDNIFLSLYPNFVCEFNSLLIPEERITVKSGELLNSELRVYALIRLGITDSVKIASFLRLSLSSIYNYRTGARNKAAVSRDTFESQVSKIGSLEFKP